MTHNDLCKMKMSELVIINSSVRALRVPGGWIYTFVAGSFDGGIATCFVPYLSTEITNFGPR